MIISFQEINIFKNQVHVDHKPDILSLNHLRRKCLYVSITVTMFWFPYITFIVWSCSMAPGFEFRAFHSSVEICLQRPVTPTIHILLDGEKMERCLP